MYFLLTKVVKEGKGGPAGLEPKSCLVVAENITKAAKKLGREIKFTADDNQTALLQLFGPEREFYEKWTLTVLAECTGPY